MLRRGRGLEGGFTTGSTDSSFASPGSTARPFRFLVLLGAVGVSDALRFRFVGVVVGVGSSDRGSLGLDDDETGVSELAGSEIGWIGVSGWICLALPLSLCVAATRSALIVPFI